MSRYVARFSHGKDGQYLFDDVEYDFDGSYEEHVAFLIDTYGDLIHWHDGSTVRVYLDDVSSGIFVIDGAYLGTCDAVYPHWEFFEVTSLDPNCFDNCIEHYPN